MRYRGPRQHGARILLLMVAALLVSSPIRAEDGAGGETPLTFRVARDVPPGATIEDVCCGGSHRFDGPPIERVTLGFGENALWLRLDLASMAGLVQLTPILDEVTLFARIADGTWQTVRTGDQIPIGERLFASPFMALPIPQDIAEPVVLVRIMQTTAVSIGAVQWELPSFVAMQAADQTLKIFLFGFVCAMIVFNCVVSALVRDPAFLLNACTVSGILLVALYLSGYGAVYVWPSFPGGSNFLLAAGLSFAIAAGSLFMWTFIRGPGEAWLRGWPLLGPGGSAVLAFAALPVLPFHVVSPWLLVSAGALMTLGTTFVVRRALAGDSRARILLFPWIFAMVPGTVLAALDRLWGIRPFPNENNLLEVTLCIEAVLFSLALTSRIRLAEKVAREAGARMLALRDDSTARAIAAQDTERRRLAIELHDGAGQSFLFVLNALRRLARSPTPPQEGTLAMLADTTATAIGDLRRISRDMHPSAIEHLGLGGALQGLFANLEAGGFDVHTQIAFDEEALPPEAKLHVYRVVQEGVANIVRHAHAGRVRFSLLQEDGLMRMTMEDDGIGIDPTEGPAGDHHGVGFSSISERVRTLGGNWSIADSELGGLALEVRVPLARKPQPGRNGP